MKPQRVMQATLAVGIGMLLLAGSAWAMGKKPPEPKTTTQTLGQGGTMTKTYNPEPDPVTGVAGVKTMEKTIGHGEKTMIIQKGPRSGATVERSWGSSPEGTSAGSGKGPSTFPGKGPSAFPGKGKGGGKWK
ncbi:MAG: hypothetical protein ACE5H5_04580 [Nitrospinota bacterium]